MTQTAQKSADTALTEEQLAKLKKDEYVAEARRQGGEEAARVAYCIAYGQLKFGGLGKNVRPAMEALLKEIARKQQFPIT